METLDRKTALVTGGAQGIGLGIARALVNAGCHVAIIDVDEAALDTARDDLDNPRVTARTLDVRDRQAYERVVQDVETELGPISILCNNAGVAGAFSISEMSYQLWDLVLGVNLGGAINGYQTVLPRMIERGTPGHIVNTAAGSGLAVAGAVAGYMYQTSKYAVVGLSESTRTQLRQAGHDIGVTVLCPGPVATNIIDTTFQALPDSMKQVPDDEQTARQAAIDQFKAYHAQGVQPDAVGTLVVDAIRHDRQYIHTDRTMWDPIWERTRRLLDAMPATEAPATDALIGAEVRTAKT
jgi:NAD(P)-dependent dehydrogenase (short-subunit alcohol dehydrogenase family)